MVNSCAMCKSHMEEHGLKPLSHYEFNKFVEKTCITGENPSKRQKRMRDNDENYSATSSVNSNSAPTSTKRARFTDAVLHPLTG